MKAFGVFWFVLSFLLVLSCGDEGSGSSSVPEEMDIQDAQGDVADDMESDEPPVTADLHPDTSDLADATWDDLSDALEEQGAEDTAEPDLPEREWVWERVAITIDDPVVVGTSLMTSIDGFTFGYNSREREMFTALWHDYDDLEVAFLWRLDEETGRHHKVYLTGDPLPGDMNFCFNETWCQFIGYDESGDEVVVLGPRTPALMRVSAENSATRSALSGTQPPNSAISYSHLFAWEVDRLLVYGFITAQGFSTELYELDLAAGEWTRPVTGLPEVYDNCLAYDAGADVLYSIGGKVTADGGETSAPHGHYTRIDRQAGTFTSVALPEQLSLRQAMSCAADSSQGLVYVFGGAVVNDYWDEEQNEYHNDLWVLETSSGVWSLLVADGPLGSFSAFGDSIRFVGEVSLPNFGQMAGRMEHDEGRSRLILVGEVPGSATQVYSLELD